MAMSQMTFDTNQVLGIASQIENDNKQLQQLLNDSNKSVSGLTATWTGPAADATRASYNAFATKFFEKYYDIMNQYVKFLRANVAEQYEQTEQGNVRLADAFK